MTCLRTLLVACLLLAIAGCARLQPVEETPDDRARLTDSSPRYDYLESDEARRAAALRGPEPDSPYPVDLWSRIREGFAMEGTDHERTEAELRYYLRHPAFMDSVAARAKPYLHYIVEQVDARGMPMEIALLPVVESAFQPFAYSHGRAAGIWQFIPGTGRHFGLDQTWWYDGRRDIVASTEAALEYLERLHGMFDGDWQLALAAYNAGEGTVMRAIRRNADAGRPTDYWSLRLPRETRHYVPRLLAVRKMVESPDVHGIAFRSIADEPYLDVVDIDSQIDLALAAEMAEIPVDDLYRLNPGYNRWATGPDGPHRIALPRERVDAFTRGLDGLPEEERVQWTRHRVESGQTLGQIARRYDTTVAVLQETNDINGHIIRAGSHLIVPVSSRPAGEYALSAEQRQARLRNSGGARIRHEVNTGDTLWDLSRQYGVEVAQIANWNGIAPTDPLRPGQELVIRTANGQAGGADERIRRISYTVRQGDSLYTIGRRFSVSVSELRRWNNLSGQRYLQPGQQLTLHVDVRNQGGN